jgi:drug/metabolite transporter (DMT)-like permease
VASRNPRDLLVSRGDFARYSALALTGYGAASICFFFALKFTDASVVAVLLYAYPAFVTVAGWLFLGEKATLLRGIAVLVTFTGCALVVGLLGGPVHVSTPGVLLGLGAAVGYTLFNLLSSRWLPGRSQLVMMGYTFGIASIGAAVASIGWTFFELRSQPALDFAGRFALSAASLSPADWSLRVWLLLVAIVIVPTFIAVVLYLQGIRGLGASQAALVSTLEPLFTIALAWGLLGERLVPIQFAGAALVLVGVVMAEVAARRVDQLAAV